MRKLALLVIGLLAWRVFCVPAAETFSDPTTLAVQRDAEERFRRLSADVQTLLDSQEVLQKRLDELRQRLDRINEEVRAAKDDQNRSSGNFSTREEMREYVKKLKEVDDKREADKKLILERIKDLAKIPVAPVPDPVVPKNKSSESAEEMPFEYPIKKNDRLIDIVAAYNELFQKQGQGKITVDQVLKANPGLKADRLVPGKKIHIPVPAKDGK